MVCDCLGLLAGGGLDWTVGACTSAVRPVFGGGAELISGSSAGLLRFFGSAFRSLCKDRDCLGEACFSSALVLKLCGVTRLVDVGIAGWAIFRGEVGGGRGKSGAGSVKKVELA